MINRLAQSYLLQSDTAVVPENLTAQGVGRTGWTAAFETRSKVGELGSLVTVCDQDRQYKMGIFGCLCSAGSHRKVLKR
jgi:hypothetical protein